MFARPFMLLLLLALPVWWWHRRRAVRPAARYSDLKPIVPVTKARRWLGETPAALRTLAIIAWVIAAAGPQVAVRPNEITREGIAITLAVDVSSSMLAEDFAPSNRLDVAKEQSKAFIRARNFDRIGLVTFAGEALTRVPVTVDYPVLAVAIDSLQVGELGDRAAHRWRKQPRTHRSPHGGRSRREGRYPPLHHWHRDGR
jgi:Ca-activated chloride channel family protein